MKTFKMIMILVLNMCLICSCTMDGRRTSMLNLDNTEEIANGELEKIVEAINKEDKEVLRTVFSKQTLGDTADFDESADHLFDFIEGEITYWEKSSGPSSSKSADYGHVIRSASSYYYISTDAQEYFFLLRDIQEDTDNPDNVGLYLLLVVKKEDKMSISDHDKKILYDGDIKLNPTGIYIPIE